MGPRLGIAVTVATCLLAGCAANGPSAPPSDGSTPADPRPVAADIVPVSASRPGPAAQAALDACLITDSTHQLGSTLGIASVAGMGEVVPARDAPRYVPLSGLEPEIRTDGPAWIIEIGGVVTVPFGEPMRNPTCVVVGGRATWFDTDAHSSADGWVTARPLALPPIYRLPPLAP